MAYYEKLAIEANDGKPLPMYQKALCGRAAGAIGACFGSPADLALICMQADATLPAAQRRHYTNAFHALYRIVADEGVLSLWKGAGPVALPILTNKAIEANDGKPLPMYQKALCGRAAGAIGACFGSPADLALIRMQANATLVAAQHRHYTNAFHAHHRIVGLLQMKEFCHSGKVLALP
ncbi:hypothetical protein RJ640_003041 [Escallonia rubra]|uniref:Uncharacterized protein n=1 Tax=Escallonia rubra TaxID=112253 RepID=A0AA88RGR5_9ASTE|nr:hypothetical protein RJ640_003041 [Escallonia rubra]